MAFRFIARQVVGSHGRKKRAKYLRALSSGSDPGSFGPSDPSVTSLTALIPLLFQGRHWVDKSLLAILHLR